MSPRLEALLERVSDLYDIVLIDTPPILAVTDPAVIGRFCGTAFMVARFEKNSASEIAYAARRLEQAGIKINGCILNGMVHTRSRYGQYGYYNYAYESK